MKLGNLDYNVVVNGYFLVTIIGAKAKNHDLCFPLIK